MKKKEEEKKVQSPRDTHAGLLCKEYTTDKIKLTSRQPLIDR